MAIAFLERVEKEPGLRLALEEEEKLLEVARGLPDPSLSPDFTDRVMDALPDGLPNAPSASIHRLPRHWPRWAPVLSAAAMVLLAFTLGRISTRSGTDAAPPSSADQVVTAPPVLRPDFSATDSGVGESLRIVHLVYAPDSGSPAQVAVAGSFNGWKAENIPMRRQGESWTATLILPPGSYEYMFVEDGARWVTDPRSPRTRADGFGGLNAVLDVDV